MTPHEKAKELVKKFDELDYGFCEVDLYRHNSKQCAIIVVEEMLNIEKKYSNFGEYEYLQQVKQEIEKL